MAMPEDLPFENAPDLQQEMQWALDDLLRGTQPSPKLWTILPLGPAMESFQALRDALPGGEPSVWKAFRTLTNTDAYKWLKALRNEPIPPRPGAEETEEEEKPNTRRIRFVEDSDIENRPLRTWIIPGILPQSGIAMLFGAPGTYKSFLAIDWALAIGYGRGWAGRATKQGPVAYIAAEGSFGLSSRIKAWKHYNQVMGNSGVRWYDQSILLQDPSHVSELLAALKEDFPILPVLLIIDTLSRCSGGADENSNTEMAKIIAAADIIQQEIGCSVLIIHHEGKDRSKGPRGASALIGNMETIISIDRVSDALEGVQIECFKQKDAERFDPVRMVLNHVQYGESTEEASIVLVKTEIPADDDNPLASAKKSEQTMYEALRGKELTLTDWVALGVARGISESSAKKARKELYEVRKVIGYKATRKLYYILEDANTEEHKEEDSFSNE